MEMCRVRVLFGRTAADLALPAEVPLVDLLPDLVDVVAGEEGDDDRWARPWQLVHPVRGALPAEASLAWAGIADGATLVLDDDPPPPPTIVEDVAQAVGEVLEARAGTPGRLLARWIGAALFGAAGGLLMLGGPPDASSATLAAVVAVFCTVLAVILTRLPELGSAGTALVGAAVPWWAAAAASLAPGHRPSLAMGAWAAAGVAFGGLVALAAPGARQVAPGVVLGATAAAAELGFFAWSGHSDVPAAAAAAVVLVAGLALLPRAAVGGSGLTLAADGTVDDRVLLRRVEGGRALQAWAQGGLLAGFGPAVVALAVADRPPTGIVVGVLAGVLALRARRSSRRAEAIPLAIAAAVAAVAVAASVAEFHPGAGRGVAAAGLAGAGAAVLASTLAGRRPRPVTHHLLERAEPFLVAGLVIAALAAAGVFGAVADLGR